MPYKNETDRLLIPKSLKRNTKLTNEQKEEIKRIYASGSLSQRKLAALYGVEKTTIFFILNPDKAELNKKRNAENRHKYYCKEKQKAYMKNTRNYRQSLYLENKLEKNQ